MVPIHESARIYAAGHRGLVESAILRRLRAEGLNNLLTATRKQLDRRDQAAVNYWFRANRRSTSSWWREPSAGFWRTRRAPPSSCTTT